MTGVSNLKFLALVIGIYILSFVTYADTATTPAQTTPTPAGVHLDQSKDVFFDQFFPYAYSLQLLQAKNTFNNHDLIIGGSLQIDGQHWYGNTITTTPPSYYKSGKGLYFTQATIDLMGNVTPWLTEMLSIADSYIGQPQPNGNYWFFNRAFVMLGNLDSFPLYAVFGVNAIPFGVFSGTGVWDNPLTSNYFNPNLGPLITVAYYKNGLNMNVSEYSDEINYRKHSVFSIYYKNNLGKFNYSLGAGYLTKLEVNAAGSALTRNAHRNIPSDLELGNIKDVNGSIGYGNLTVNGEYDQGSQHTGANTEIPKAVNIGISYIQNIADKDTTFAVNRSKSIHLNNVPTSLFGHDGIPISLYGLQSAWAISASRPIFLNIITLGIDFEKSETYSAETNYTGTVEVYFYL